MAYQRGDLRDWLNGHNPAPRVQRRSWLDKATEVVVKGAFFLFVLWVMVHIPH